MKYLAPFILLLTGCTSSVDKCYNSKIEKIQKKQGYVFDYEKRYARFLCENPKFDNITWTTK